MSHRLGARNVFQDVTAIVPGHDFTHAIDEALDASDAVLAVIGPSWLEAAGPDGTPRLIISNDAKLPGVLVHGKEKPLDRPQAGLIFLNDEGSEIGGLIFGGRKDKDGKVRDSGGSLSFDRYEANQVVQLLGVDDSEDRFAGLAISDSPSGNDVRRRIWLGRGDDGEASLALLDGAGNKRIVMKVAENGESSISVLDATGKTVKELLP